MKTRPHFQLGDALADDITVVEASAGTGKTYALASLAVRLIASGDVDARGLLVVTFTKAATAELRQRIRQRLVDVTLFLTSGVSATADPLFEAVSQLAAVDGDVANRIAQAVSDFDEITVSTIHGFAQQVLRTFGLAAQVDPDLAIVGDDSDLVRSVCANTLAVAAVGDVGDVTLPSLKMLINAVNACQNMTDLVVLPDIGDQDGSHNSELTSQTLLAHLIASVRFDLVKGRRAAGQRNYADLLTDLRDALVRPAASAAIAAVRSRYRVALIDEFQDTDPVQWDIFTSLFGGTSGRSDAKMVVVGDPKQAIYRFRGADINAYLRVVSSHLDVRVLATNWRSDKPVIDAFNGLFEGATFGTGVDYLPVQASPTNQISRMWVEETDGAISSRHHQPGLVVRLALHQDIGPIKSAKSGFLVPDIEDAVRRDLVAHLVELFDHGCLDDPRGSTRPIGPTDVAVLVMTHVEADEVHHALQAAGVPAVVVGTGSVFESDAADQWRLLLSALAAPSDSRRARAAALTVFGGFDSAGDVADDDDVIAVFQQQLVEWSSVLTERGVSAFVLAVRHESRFTARVLVRPDGDRLLTDLEHLGDLFQVHHGSGTSSPATLLEVLNRPPEASDDTVTAGNEHSRRVETDADAVQIMTVHGSKGLEFPIVCCPSLFKPPRTNTDPWAIFDDPDTHDRILDLEPDRKFDDGTTTPRSLEALDERDERLRLAYVALTRARHQTIVWWGNRVGCQKSALARLLFARDDSGNIDPKAYFADEVDVPPASASSTWGPGDPWKLVDATKAVLAPLVDRINANAESDNPVIVVDGFAPADNIGRRWVVPQGSISTDAVTSTWGVAEFDRSLDHRARRWSFTAITARGHDTARDDRDAADELRGADEGPTVVDPIVPVDIEVDGEAEGVGVGVAVSPLATLPAGASFGLLVHKVLELVDFTDPDLAGSLGEVIEAESIRRVVDLTPIVPAGEPPDNGAARLRDGLVAVTRTPLGSVAGNITLAHVAPTDRRNELGFELLLGAPDASATDADIGRLVLAHIAGDDPYRGWATDLADGLFSADLVGHLTGEIDLVLRVHGPDGPRFVIVDYKTNRLHEPGRLPGPTDYDQPAMAAAMTQHHYPLQALLYSVALHRYLRWRLVGYDPQLHLGGAAYLFVRGMAGEATPSSGGQVQGVCDWAIPPDLVVALSTLLDGRRSVRSAT